MNAGILTSGHAPPQTPGPLLGSPTAIEPIDAYGYDADALRYIRAVEAADGQRLELSVRVAVNEFVVGCKSDGNWQSITTCHLFMGARSLAGALVPLVGPGITNVNFVSGDYTRGGATPGLKGDGSTKRLSFVRSPRSEPANNFSFGIFCTDGVTTNGQAWSHNGGGQQGASLISLYNSGLSRRVDAANRNIGSVILASSLASQFGFYGTSRSTPDGWNANLLGSIIIAAQTSQPILGSAVAGLFARPDGAGFTNPRICFTWFGLAVDLLQLRIRTQSLVSAMRPIT